MGRRRKGDPPANKQVRKERNEPWNPAPPSDEPTVSMFEECPSGAHIIYRNQKVCRACNTLPTDSTPATESESTTPPTADGTT